MEFGEFGIVLNLILLIIGFVLLVQSANVFVDASVGIARYLKVPTLVIGLTVVAMGTSTPELVISVSAALGGNSSLAIANAVGSNLFNLLFIVGFCAMLYPISVQTARITRDYWVSVAATVALLILIYTFAGSAIPRLGGFMFLVGFAVYMLFVVRSAMKNRITEEADDEDKTKQKPLWKNMVLAIISVVFIMGSGQLTVMSAIGIAEFMGVSERVIGLTIVSIGTSLPELVTTIIACRKKEGEFAIGFIIGSSIFNLMFVLGLAGAIMPLAVESSALFDIAVLTIGTLAFFFYAKSGQKLVRLEGFLMVLMYAGYMGFVLLM